MGRKDEPDDPSHFPSPWDRTPTQVAPEPYRVFTEEYLSRHRQAFTRHFVVSSYKGVWRRYNRQPSLSRHWWGRGVGGLGADAGGCKGCISPLFLPASSPL